MMLILCGCNSGSHPGVSCINSPSDRYQKIYAQIVTEQADDNIMFSLILLDNDEIPELAVYDQYYENLSIYTLKDNDPFCLLDSMHAVEVSYFEKTGMLAKFARWNGGGDEGGYGLYYYQVAKNKTLTEDSTPLLYNTYDAVYDEKGGFAREGVMHYYQNEQELDEYTYQEELAELGIEEEGISCMDKAMQENEIMKLLGE